MSYYPFFLGSNVEESEEENSAEFIFQEMLVSDMLDQSWDHSNIWGDPYVDVPPRIIRPKRTRPFAGADLVRDILGGHEERSYEYFRLSADCVNLLNDQLVQSGSIRSTKYVRSLEQVCMFLYILAHSLPNRHGCETFQHSGETLSRYFNEVLEGIVGLMQEYIRLPPTEPNFVHPHIEDQEKFYPYFKGALGAIDGTYIPACVRKSKHNRYRCRKGFIAQNVMGVVSFDHTFLYVAAGMEGSAADMRVLKTCLETDRFTVPRERYYLVDSGYANTDAFLAPYRRSRYHITEYQRSNVRNYRDAKDKYNHRHSQLRNCVEKAWGILKQRFKILKCMLPYPYKTQVKIVLACCVLHNFIRRHNNQDLYFNMLNEWINPEPVDHHDDEADDMNNYVGRDEAARGEALRVDIATQLWNNGG